MTSYQRRKEDIRKLMAIIDVLVGDNKIAAEETRLIMRLQRDMLNVTFFGSRQTEPPFTTGGIIEQITPKP